MSEFEKDSITDLDTEDITGPSDTADQALPSKEEDGGSILDELEFISHDSVKDRKKMTNTIEEHASRKKLNRRKNDGNEAKKQQIMHYLRRHFLLIIIGIVIIIILLCILNLLVKNSRANQAMQNQAQPVSTQEYETDEYTLINELMESYYEAYADGDTDSILQYAYPMSESEKSYIEMFSKYVEDYQNITCYTKTGQEENSYIVSASFYLKFKDVETTAPGLDFFYVKTTEDGKVYIDNTYSPFNLLYQEYPLDQSILQMIQDYESGDDVTALQASVQTQYESRLESDEKLKTLEEVTIAGAIADWNAKHQAELQEKADAAASQVNDQKQEEAANQETSDSKENTSTKVTFTEKKAWVYVTDDVMIRKKPSKKSEALASAMKNSQVRQLGTTSNGWTKVKSGDVTGYIKSEYISKKKSQ